MQSTNHRCAAGVSLWYVNALLIKIAQRCGRFEGAPPEKREVPLARKEAVLARKDARPHGTVCAGLSMARESVVVTALNGRRIYFKQGPMLYWASKWSGENRRREKPQARRSNQKGGRGGRFPSRCPQANQHSQHSCSDSAFQGVAAGGKRKRRSREVERRSRQGRNVLRHAGIIRTDQPRVCARARLFCQRKRPEGRSEKCWTPRTKCCQTTLPENRPTSFRFPRPAHVRRSKLRFFNIAGSIV
jgi:hypothetical protein